MQAIVKVLWGAETDVSRWIKLLNTDIPKNRVHNRAPCACYVYGKDNADMLTQRGYKDVVLVNDDPWPDGWYDRQRSDGNDFYRPWHYKWELILRAMQDYDEIIYCDWDYFCLEPDVAKVFGKLEGRPLDYTLTLNCYRRPQQTMWREERSHRRFCVGGYWVHLRSTKFAEDVLANMDPDPTQMLWHDELVMSKMIDDLHGGDWPGLDVWLRNYESPIVVSPHKRQPYATIYDDGKIVRRDTPIPFQWERIFRPR